MGFLSKLFGPSLDELVNRELEKRKVVLTSHSIKQDAFKEKLARWKPPIFSPPKNIDEYILNKKYVYKKVELKLIPDDLHFKFDMIGKKVEFVSDPTNEYDPGAIIVQLDGKFIGYIPKNTLQSMIHDFIKRNEPIYSVISDLGIDEDTELIDNVNIFLGFYYNPQKCLDNSDKLIAKLTKTSKKDCFDNTRQDNYCFANKGEYINLEYDSDVEAYIVSADGFEIGETNATVTKKLQEFDNNCEYIGIIDDIIENDDTGKYGATITIFMK